MIAEFNSEGNLPAGVHWANWQEIVDRFGSTPQRRVLLEGLRDACRSLRNAGCRTVYIDGSFVTAKPVPGDFDACWEVSDVDPALLDPVLLVFDRGRAAQKARFGGELFPAQLPNGITGLTFLEFFQIDKVTGNPKGIVALDLRNLSP